MELLRHRGNNIRDECINVQILRVEQRGIDVKLKRRVGEICKKKWEVECGGLTRAGRSGHHRDIAHAAADQKAQTRACRQSGLLHELWLLRHSGCGCCGGGGSERFERGASAARGERKATEASSFAARAHLQLRRTTSGRSESANWEHDEVGPNDFLLLTGDRCSDCWRSGLRVALERVGGDAVRVGEKRPRESMRVGLRMCGAGREREAGEESVSSGSARVGDEEPCPSGHWSAGSVAGGEDEDVEKEDNSGRAEERKAFSEEMSLVVSTASSPKLVSSGGKASSTGGRGGAGTLSLVGIGAKASLWAPDIETIEEFEGFVGDVPHGSTELWAETESEPSESEVWRAESSTGFGERLVERTLWFAKCCCRRLLLRSGAQSVNWEESVTGMEKHEEVQERSPSSTNLAASASRGLSTNTGTPKPSKTSEEGLNVGEWRRHYIRI